MHRHFAGMLFLCLLLTACSSNRVLEQWPQSIPQQAYFLQLYRADTDNQARQTEREYLTWVARFYQGWELMPYGWEDITESVLVDLSPRQQQGLARRMQRLGAQISGEWAKDNEVRLIDSGMLSLWASVMQADFSPSYRLSAVELIADDVGELLTGSMPPESVDEFRYGELLGVSLEP